MEYTLPIAIISGIAVYLLAVMLIPKRLLQDEKSHVRNAVARLAMTQDGTMEEVSSEPVGLDHPLVRAYLLIPGARGTLPLLSKAGLTQKLPTLITAGMGIFFALLLLTSRLHLLGVLISVILTGVMIVLYVKGRVKKVKRDFLEAFPDALDIIVRSVRSGYPLNTALAIVAENMGPPVSTEFKRVVDETAYGWSMQEALERFRERLQESDVDFFVTVLSVQQESGGNLSEVLQNLSKVIRSRKHLRLKIRALSSEGRTTAWVLGALPFLVVLTVNKMVPTHFDPLIYTTVGKIIIGVILGMMLTGALMVKRIINIDI